MLVTYGFRGSWCIDQSVPDCKSTKESQKMFVKLIEDNWNRILDVSVVKKFVDVHLSATNCDTFKEKVLTASFTVRVMVQGNDCQPLTCSGVNDTWPFLCLLYITNIQVWNYCVIIIYNLHLVVYNVIMLHINHVKWNYDECALDTKLNSSIKCNFKTWVF